MTYFSSFLYLKRSYKDLFSLDLLNACLSAVWFAVETLKTNRNAHINPNCTRVIFNQSKCSKQAKFLIKKA